MEVGKVGTDSKSPEPPNLKRRFGPTGKIERVRNLERQNSQINKRNNEKSSSNPSFNPVPKPNPNFKSQYWSKSGITR